MSWFERIVPSRIKTERRTRSVPEGLWTKCPACDAVLYRAEIERNLHVCPKCSHHMRINGRERLSKFLDTGSTTELATKVEPEDPLKFKDSKRYKDRLTQAQKQTGERDALIVMAGKLAGLDVVACAFEFRFLGGSMGSVVGEKFVLAVEHCLEHRMPLVCFAASGGARMQEGAVLAAANGEDQRCAQALVRGASALHFGHDGSHHRRSFRQPGHVGDINIGEPKALIGFAGPRVIQQTVRETLPEGFQRSEFLLEHGALDMIVDRRELRDRIGAMLRLLTGKEPAAA